MITRARWVLVVAALAGAAAWLAACDFNGAVDKCVQEGRCIDTDAGASDGG